MAEALGPEALPPEDGYELLAGVRQSRLMLSYSLLSGGLLTFR